MIVGDFDGNGLTIFPLEANSILVVDPNAVLPTAIATKSLKSIARRHFQIGQCDGGIELVELSPG